MRQDGPVHTLGAEHVDVIQLGQLLGGERLAGPVDHMSGIVHHDVDPAMLSDDCIDRIDSRLLRPDIELDAPQVDVLFAGELCDRGNLVGVLRFRTAHRSVDEVPGLCERLRRHSAKAARRAGDQDDLLVLDVRHGSRSA